MLSLLVTLWQCRLTLPKLKTEALKCVTGFWETAYELCLSSNFPLSCALVAVDPLHSAALAPWSQRGRRVALLKLSAVLEVKQGSWGHIWIAVPALFAFLNFLPENELQSLPPGFCPGHWWRFPVWVAGLHYQFSCWGKHGQLKKQSYLHGFQHSHAFQPLYAITDFFTSALKTRPIVVSCS